MYRPSLSFAFEDEITTQTNWEDWVIAWRKPMTLSDRLGLIHAAPHTYVGQMEDHTEWVPALLEIAHEFNSRLQGSSEHKYQYNIPIAGTAINVVSKAFFAEQSVENIGRYRKELIECLFWFFNSKSENTSCVSRLSTYGNERAENTIKLFLERFFHTVWEADVELGNTHLATYRPCALQLALELGKLEWLLPQDKAADLPYWKRFDKVCLERLAVHACIGHPRISLEDALIQGSRAAILLLTVRTALQASS
jgi:hypothetical protein